MDAPSLFSSVRTSNVLACRAVVEEHGSGVLHARDPQGLTPLHHACIQGAREVAAYLVEAGSDVNARGARGETPLQYAVLRGALPVATLLLRAGADTCARDASGYTILHHAVLARQIAIVYELIEVNPGLIKIQDDIGRTCLHWASYAGLQEVTERLVSSGSDVNIQDRDGFTPLHLAALFGHNLAAKALVEKGAVAMKERKEGRKPFECASSKGHHALALYLLWAANRTLPRTQSSDSQGTLAAVAGFATPVIGPAVVSLISKIWALPILVIGAVMVRYLKKKYDRKRAHTGKLALGIFLGSVVALSSNVLFGLATWQAPFSTLLFTIAASATWYLCARLLMTSVDAGVVEASEREREEVAVATSKGTYPKDYCVTCAVKRLPRMKHCSVCGKCISKFDHHCVFLLGDVGEKNHKFFWLLILSVLISVISFIRLAVIHLINNYGDDTIWMNTSWMGFCIFWTICNSYWIFGLFFLQTRLIASNLTYNEYINAGRYEYLKDSHGKFFNPYDRGGITNVMMFLGLVSSQDTAVP